MDSNCGTGVTWCDLHIYVVIIAYIRLSYFQVVSFYFMFKDVKVQASHVSRPGGWHQ